MKNRLMLLMVMVLGCIKPIVTQATPQGESQGTPLVYNRELLTINSSVEVPNPAYVASEDDAAKPSANVPLPSPQPSPARGEGATEPVDKSTPTINNAKPLAQPKTFTQTRAHVFYITCEASDAMSKNWFINSTNIQGNKGVLYLLDTPALPTISPSTSLQANDILFIGSYGAVKAIAKNISPAELAEPMELEVTVKGILYLEAGMADKLGIKPFDMVDYSAFPKQPNLTK